MDSLLKIEELYGKGQKHLLEHSNDVETEPYKSLYLAVEYFKKAQDSINEEMEKADTETTKEKYKAMLIHILALLGTIAIDTEEFGSGEKYLNECLATIKDDTDPKILIAALAARCQLGMLWATRSDNDKAKHYLEDCLAVYDRFVEIGKLDSVLTIGDHFSVVRDGDPPDREKEVEKVRVMAKFYLAQIYSKLGDKMKSAAYCYQTLCYQLEAKTYDPIDWALNSATLSQFFLEKNQFTQARYLLSAASYMLDTHEENLKTMELSEEEAEAKKEELRYRSADVARCWGKYGVFLLEYSRSPEQDETFEHPEELKNCCFPSLELTQYENQVTDQPVVDYDSARNVFLMAQKWFDYSKEYYSLENHASDYALIVQSISSLIRNLTFFEKDESRICKFLKNRINILEEVVKELNPQYYMSYCQAIWFELGEAHYDLMTIKWNKIRANTGLPNPADLSKCNRLAMSAIRYLNDFLNTIKGKSDKLPDVISDGNERPTLVAHFYLGLVHHRIITPDKRQSIENTRKARDCFKYIIDYCNTNDRAKLSVLDELEAAESLSELLERKLIRELSAIS